LPITATSFLSATCLRLDVRCANLTIGNESKKITSVAFVPDGVVAARCATSSGHATPLEAARREHNVERSPGYSTE